MPRIEMDPTVAEFNPNVYNAAVRSGLDAASSTQIQQLSWTQKKAKQLLTLSPEKAREEFLKLDPTVKSNINYLYPNKAEFAPEINPNLAGRLLQGASTVAKAFGATFFSPLIQGMEAAEKYGKALGTPYAAARQMQQGADFSKKLLSDMFDGKNSWNWDMVKQYEDKYGRAITTLARAYSEGRNTGEAMDLYTSSFGTLDDEFLQAISFSRDNPKSFQQIKDSLKQDAQISPGRDIAKKLMVSAADGDYWAGVFTRMLDGKAGYGVAFDVSTPEGKKKAEQVFGKPWMQIERERASKISGKIDAVYRVLTDPLTYIGIGAPLKAITKGVGGIEVGAREAFQRFGGLKSKGQKLADQFLFVSERKGMEQGYAWLFNDVPEVKTLWDKQLGPDIKRFAEAKTDTEKGSILREMKSNYPEWYDTSVVRKFAKYKVFDAVSAQKYFTNVDNEFAILSGNVDGISFNRNTIPYARRSRLLTSAVSRTVFDFFNRPVKASEVPAAEIQRLDALDILSRVGQKEGELLNLNIEDLDRINAGIKGARKVAYQLGRAASRSPGPILWGIDADKTANSIRNTLGLVIDGRDTVEALTLTLLDAPQEVQLAVVRNAQYAYMKKLGIPDDEALVVLNKTYNESSLGIQNKMPIAPAFADVMNKKALQVVNDVPYLISRGAIHPSQLKGGIAPLPFDELFQLSSKGLLQKTKDKDSKAKSLLMVANGVTRKSTVAKYNDFWAGYTLFPRLGMRTNVDESFFIYINQPTSMLAGWAGAKIGPEIAAQTALTKSSAGIGMYKGSIFWIADKLGVKINGKSIDPRKVYTPEQKQKMLVDLQKRMSEKAGYEIPISEISRQSIRDMFTTRIEELYNVGDRESWNNLKKIAKHQDNFGNALISSLGARNTLTSRVSRDYLDTVISDSNINLALEQMGLSKLKQYRPELISRLSQKEIAVAMYDNFPLRFGYNQQKISPNRYFRPVEVFFKNNALETPTDFRNAKRDLLEQVGVVYYAANNFVEVEDAKTLSSFLAPYGETIYFRQQGLADAEIAEVLIDTQLIDSRIAFHGSETGFNKNLLDVITKKYNDIIRVAPKTKTSTEDAWSRAATSLTFDEFFGLTDGYRPVTGEINTRLVSSGLDVDLKNLENITGIQGWLEVLTPGQLLEFMDKQVTGFLRQPLLLAATNKAFKQLKPFEEMMARRHIAALTESNPQWGAKKIKQYAEELAEKQTVELATNQAINTVLEFVDNPNVRSNFALSVKHLGRFYRATEDFQRRVYRTYTKNTLRSFYRLRALTMGLQSMGSIYTDEAGDDYYLFPTDSIISGLVQPVVNAFGGEFKVPTATNFAIKFRLINPSFAPDAGAPALAGPVAGLSMLFVKAVLRELDFPLAQKAADVLDRYGMGHIGRNTDLSDALRVALPMMGTTLLDLARPAETDSPLQKALGANRNKANVVLQGMAALQAEGNGLSINSTPEQQYEYIKNLKIAANNFTYMQSFLGYFVSPGFPTLKETESIPDYLKEVGISSPSSDFWNIFEGIRKNADDADLSTIWDLATATFVGKNPGKLIYTIPRTEKNMRVVINKTDNLKNWAQNNKNFIDIYGETAFIFAPTIGEYNPDIYGWLEAAGLVKQTAISDYLDAVQVAEDKQIYFAISDTEKEQLSLAVDYNERKSIIARSEQYRRQLTISNPKLQSALDSQEDRGQLIQRLTALNGAITSPNTPISKQAREVMQVASKEIGRMLELDKNQIARNSRDYTDQKRALKQEITTILDDLAAISPEVKEANRLIFRPLLNELSRDSVSASARG